MAKATHSVLSRGLLVLAISSTPILLQRLNHLLCGRWLAVRVGLPLSAPAESTRGWDITALAGGIAGLPVDAAQGLGIFCR